jgi:hypothetical protein
MTRVTTAGSSKMVSSSHIRIADTSYNLAAWRVAGGIFASGDVFVTVLYIFSHDI